MTVLSISCKNEARPHQIWTRESYYFVTLFFLISFYLLNFITKVPRYQGPQLYNHLQKSHEPSQLFIVKISICFNIKTKKWTILWFSNLQGKLIKPVTAHLSIVILNLANLLSNQSKWASYQKSLDLLEERF